MNVQHCTWLGSPMCAASGGSSTWGNTWESRTLPDSTKKSLRRCLGLFLCASRQFFLPGRLQANVQHCTWLGSPMCAASGGSSTWGNTWESRTLPDSTKKSLRRCLGLFLCASRQVLLPGRFQANVQHCTWLGYRPPRPVGETGGRYHLGEFTLRSSPMKSEKFLKYWYY